MLLVAETKSLLPFQNQKRSNSFARILYSHLFGAALPRLPCRIAPFVEGARWSNGINAANGARGPRFASRGSRPVYYLLCSDLGQVVNLSLSAAQTGVCPAASG